MFPTLLALLRSPGLLARVRLRRELRSFLRLQFLAVALQAQLLDLLRTPTTVGELRDRLSHKRPDALAELLDLGVALGELRRSGSTYEVRSRTARALAAPTGTALRAAVLELVNYHAAAYRDLPGHLLGDREKDYLADKGVLIAHSSQFIEPVLGPYVRKLVSGRVPMRILELGCGSGIYLRHAHNANPHATGVGLEIEPDVVNVARGSLESWGLAHRFAIVQGDARRLPPELVGDFDLITLYNNIYYFAPQERVALFRELRARLAPEGRLAIVSMMRGRTLTSLSLSLVLDLTRGCTALPNENELAAGLRQGGFTDVRRRNLLPGEPLVALLAAAAA